MLFCKKNERNKGFSLMEVIISVGIVSFAFVGIMSVFASNIRVEIANRDRVAASYLAQEAVEVIRQKRDTNWFTGATNWDDGIQNGNDRVLSLVDPDDLSKGWNLVNAGGANSYKKRIFLYDGKYVQSSENSYNDINRPLIWKDTKFRRIINIQKSPGVSYRMQMTVTVYYGANNQKVQLVSYLYNNWYTN